MSQELITINPNEIRVFAEEGGKLVFKKEAEENLIKLLEAQKVINEAVENAKEAISNMGRQIDPGFKGVIGERIRATYRAYGEKYDFVWNQKDVAKPFIKEVTRYKVDSAKVDSYVKEVGELPDGIVEKERTESLSLSLQDEGGEND